MNNRVSSLLNVSTENLVERVNSLLEEKKRLEQKNTELNRALISGEGEQDNQNLEKIGKNIIFSIIETRLNNEQNLKFKNQAKSLEKKKKSIRILLVKKLRNNPADVPNAEFLFAKFIAL